mmetsp:Transcript_79645/g.110658  ORF Transcript_79645/g.110658 Transcript_79645/m.110658 type:complete len:268 (+) Transcript_79645:291-1094(+)
MVLREEAGEEGFQLILVQAIHKLLHTPLFGELLEYHLDEDTGTRCRCVLRNLHLRPNAPRDSVRVQQMREELSDVAQFVGLEPVHRVELDAEGLGESVLIDRVQAAQALCLEDEEPVEHLLHGAAVNEHGAHLLLLTLGNVELQDLVHALLVVHRRHDHEVDGPAQVHQILFREVQNLLLRATICSGVRLLIRIVAAVAALILFEAQNLAGDKLPLGLIRSILLGWNGLEDVQGLLALDRLIQKVHLVRDLVFVFDEVELFQNHRVI